MRVRVKGESGSMARDQWRRDPRNRPEDFVLAWLKRQHRIPLTALETSWLLGKSTAYVATAQKEAFKKIREELERTMHRAT